ncbi:DUF3298 domain-containing protein [Neobacillus niacini]|uniref:DUF3298 and DUF4163 domain-containing protein n=1 Tax=Neobacillus niacini TaxID=86668 RepID=UPI00286563C1|nr:DUF3298 domain-containing protein [Neobacillus niacini]MDR7002028.1 hypothetical protein [Neobacillus niacini]
MTAKKMEELKKEYDNISIPNELDFVVRKALQQGGVQTKKAKKIYKKVYAGIGAAAVLSFILGMNTSAAFASTMSKIPVIGSVAKVVTFRTYTVNEDQSKADIAVPKIQGVKNKTLENSLNKKYIEEGKAQFKNFKEQVKYVKGAGGGHVGIKSGYEVKTDNDQILSIERYNVSTTNGYASTQFDTIDKQHEILITLPSLFKNDSYIGVISENIKKQMREQYAQDPSNVYWIAGISDFPGDALFQKIKKNQDFYINKDGKLVICFQKYEVAPGAMGEPEFAIPTKLISNILVSNTFIK